MLSDLPLPERVGRYEIVLQIARGGMATVYLARAEGVGGFDRYVALKLTAEHLREDEEFAAHLIDEAKLVAHLRHSNIVPVLDADEDETGAIFLVMDYIPGDSLGGLLRTAKKQGTVLPPRVGFRILIDALGGLHAAHEHSDEDGTPYHLVHRDFSPANILVGTDGIARLTDFGIAKAASRTSMTRAGTMKGKVSYASPEQARGEPLDRRCDVWAGGVIAWELLANRKLHPAGANTLREVVRAPPPRIRDVVPGVTAELDEVIAGALAMEVARRTPTALAFARALTDAARAAGMLAEVEEVADYVKKAVAPILLERKARIDEARRLREAAEVPELGDDGLVTVTKTMRLSDLPELPMEPGRSDPEPTDATVPMDRDALAAAFDTAHRAEAIRDERLPESVSVPSATPAGMSTSTVPVPQGGPTEPIEIPGLRNRLHTVLGPIRERLGPFVHERVVPLGRTAVARTRRFAQEKPKVALAAAGGAATLLLVVLVALIASGGDGDVAANGRGSASSSARGAHARDAPTTTTASAATPPARLEDPEPLLPQLEVSANAPIAKVRVGKRVVDVEVAAPRVSVELTSEESAGSLPVAITSNDGRTATGTWTPGEGDVSLDFGEARPKRRR